MERGMHRTADAMQVSGTTGSTICEAIRARRLLAFEYGGESRVVAPYCHGISRSGEVLRGVQVRGGSQSRGFGFGKLWMVSRMHDVRIMDEAFVPRDPHYNPDDSAMLSIHCRI
jgi:hypothetical protein